MKTDDFKIRFGLTPKLFILVLLSFGLLMAVIVWRIGLEADLVANAAIDKSLKQSDVILETTLATRFGQITETAHSLARDGRVLPRLFEGDSGTLQDLTSEFKAALEFDILFFLDADGVILARSDDAAAIGKSVAKRDLFNTALQGQVARGMMVSQDKLLQIVAVPVRDNVAKEVVRGVVALAYPLSASMAADINQLTSSEIGFFIYGVDAKDKQPTAPRHQFMTHTELGKTLDVYFQQNSAVWQNIQQNKTTHSELVIALEQDQYHAVIYPLLSSGGGALGFIAAVRSRAELIKPFTMIQQQALIVGGACLLMASLLAWGLAGRIARPIVQLVTVTQAIQEGQFAGGTPDYTQHDEVGVLYRAVYRMGKELKDKAELESYLAQLGEVLEGDSSLADGVDDIVAAAEASIYQDSGFSGRDGDTIPDHSPVLESTEKTVVNERTQVLPVDNDRTQVTDDALLAVDEEPSATDLQPGTIFAQRYKILKALGAGAMGAVYLAKDVELDEAVALKIIFASGLEGSELEQFKQEIRLARKITHRNILRTFDFGTAEQLHFITMEFVHGFDLNELIRKKGKLEPHIALLMARQICSAVAAAHEQGIIHRDLKPQNMMINRQGILKIMDFGLAMRVAKPVVAGVGGAGAEVEATSQQTVGVAGTPNYMAPEQFTADELDVRADIYAIGIILFKMFTGVTPYSGRNFEELANQHLTAPIPLLSQVAKNLPPVLDGIISKAMAKDRQQRFGSINELQSALQSVNLV